MLTKRNLGWFSLNPLSPACAHLEVPIAILNQMPRGGKGGRLGYLNHLCAQAHNGIPAIDVRMNAEINPTYCIVELPHGATDATVDSLCSLIMESRVK